MTMRMQYKEYSLSEAAVDTVSAAVQDYLCKQNLERHSVQRIRLTVEELLLNLLAHCGKNMKFSIGLGKQFGRKMFRLRFEGKPFDPTQNSNNPLADEMMRLLGLSPVWSCRGKVNTVSLVLADKPKRSMVFYIMLAVLSAVLLGILGNTMPENVRMIVTDAVLSPLSNAFLGLLNTFAGIMILLTICSGIIGMGDSAAIGRMGKSVVARFIGILLLTSSISAAITLPFVHLNLSSVSAGQVSAPASISQMFFDILPQNIIDPFRTGNTFHIIVIAAFIGCALLALGERGSHIREWIGEASLLFQQIVSSVCSLVPLFIFSMLLRLVWSGELRMLVSVVKPIILITALSVALVMVLWIISSLYLKCPPIRLLKSVLPAFAVAFSTASSMSAFQISTETCEKKLGANHDLTSFIYPLGSVIYMPASVVYFTVIVCAFAEIYQIAVNLPWLIMAVAICTCITIAMPPVPGADILCYSVLFSSLGIPSEAMILSTAAGLLLDYLLTGINVVLLIFQVACDAKRFGKLDQKILLGQ